MNSLFKVDGKPFFAIGGQAHNSSPYSEGTMFKAWKAIKALGMNSIAAPIHWAQIEPEQGKYDFKQIDHLLKGARENDVKLILLWFASWKNGTSQYAPTWVKKDKERFIWVENAQNVRTRVLSPVCVETNNADKNAFAQVMKYIKEIDDEKRIIGFQLQNEPGMFGSPRDYSDIGEKAYSQSVKPELVEWLNELNDCYVKKAWQDNGSKQEGTWEELFGYDGPEIYTAYSFATYIDNVAEAGKKYYDLPMYVNVWIREAENRVPGIGYPSGGPVSTMLDLWKKFTPHIDALCPDVYIQDAFTFKSVCEAYSRSDNPLYIPESASSTLGTINAFKAIAEYGLTGIHSFGVDSLVDNDGNLKEDVKEYADSVKCLTSLKPLIEKYHGTDKLHAVGKYEGAAFQFIDFGDYFGVVNFFDSTGLFSLITTPNFLNTYYENPEDMLTRARGMIIYEGNGVFYLSGAGFKLILTRKDNVETMTSVVRGNDIINTRHMEYLSIDEGYIDSNGNYIVDNSRCGDEADYGVWVHPDVGLVRIVMDFGGN